MRIACFHTAAIHQHTFSALFAEQAPEASLIHMVRDDLLSEAQVVGVEALIDPVLEALGALSSADAILCTCSTLGPLVDTIQSNKYIRVDRPVMEAASEHGPKILLALCLESTRTSSLALLTDVRGDDLDATVTMSEAAWPLFMRGELDAFADAVAADVAIAAPGHDAIVLGQASMAVAAPSLSALGIPVLTSPPLAVARAIAVASS